MYLRFLLMCAVASLTASCATVASQPALTPSATPLELGPEVRTLAVMPVGTVLGRTSLDSINQAMARELATEVERSMVGSPRYRVVTGCEQPCSAADATLQVGFIASSTNPTIAFTFVGDLPGVAVDVIARVVRSDGSVIEERSYQATRLSGVSGRQFTRSVKDLTRDALHEARLKLLADLYFGPIE